MIVTVFAFSIGGLLGAIVALVGARLVLRARPFARVDTESCARCLYPTTGLPTSICPECGADTQQVGVLPPGRHGLRFVTAVVTWSVFFLLAAGGASLFVLTWLPNEQVRRSGYEVALANQDAQVRVRATVTRRGFFWARSASVPHTADRVTLEDLGRPARPPLRIDAPARQPTLRDQIHSWLRATGPGVPAPATAALTELVVTRVTDRVLLIRHLPSSAVATATCAAEQRLRAAPGVTSLVKKTATRYRSPAPFLASALTGMAALGWLIGVLYLWRKRATWTAVANQPVTST